MRWHIWGEWFEVRLANTDSYWRLLQCFGRNAEEAHERARKMAAQLLAVVEVHPYLMGGASVPLLSELALLRDPRRILLFVVFIILVVVFAVVAQP